MHNIKNKKDTHLSKKKRILFKLTLLFIPLLFFTMFEITLRVFNYGGNRDLFIPASSPYTNYKKCNPLIAKGSPRNNFRF